LFAVGVEPAARKACQRHRWLTLERPLAAPGKAINEGSRRALRQEIRRPPEHDDIVVDLQPRGYLVKFDPAAAPIADWLDPQARAALIFRFEVEEIRILAAPLHQPEAAWAAVHEGADLQGLGIG